MIIVEVTNISCILYIKLVEQIDFHEIKIKIPLKL